ncbi:hypothetical protein Unana1_05278 [Umbelopsis nana]
MKNQYILKATAADRPCFVCSKFSSAVLTSADNSNEDWFYVCKSHLTDANFCSVNGGQASRTASPATTAPKQPIVKDSDAKPESNSVSDLLTGIGSGIWNSWKGNTKSDQEPNKEKDKSKDENKKATESPVSSPSSPPSTTSTPPPKPKPATYILHRDFYYLREREVQKRRMKKDTAARFQNILFPEVPKTVPPSLTKRN